MNVSGARGATLTIANALLANAVNPSRRLSTSGAATLPNPVVDFRKSLRFNVWREHTLRRAMSTPAEGHSSQGALSRDG